MKDKSVIEKRWESSGSYCVETLNAEGRAHYEGTYKMNGVAFPFTCNEQTNGKQMLRGQISIFSQRRGRLLRIREKGADDKPQIAQKSIYPNIFASDGSLLPKASWQNAVMERVESAALKMLREYQSTIKRDIELSATPGNITPQMALTLYGDTYLRINHRNAVPQSQEDYRRILSRFYQIMPNIPMCDVRKSHIQDAEKASGASQRMLKIARDFWQFCVDGHYCDGSNPFPISGKKRKSAQAKQAAADRLDVLDKDMQEDIYKEACGHPSGPMCGLHLLLSGFDDRYVCELQWDDLDILENGEIRLPLKKEDNAGATHAFDRIVAPQCRDVLHLRREMLLQKYGKTRLKTMPVVSLASNPEKAIKPDDLGKKAAGVIQRHAIQKTISAKASDLTGAAAVRICLNTYHANLDHECALHEDSGMRSFLSGESLTGNVTADHYRSFTDSDGVEQQYKVLRRMAPEKPIAVTQEVDYSHPEYDQYTYAAPTTRDLISLSILIDNLETDQKVSVLDRSACNMRAKCKSV